MEQMTFNRPGFLLALMPVVLGMVWYLLRDIQNREASLEVSSSSITGINRSWRVATYWVPTLFRFMAILFIVLALSRPGKSITYSSINRQGIDIFVVLDVSRSMSAEDFQPKNRLMVAKQVVKDFAGRRTSDRIGMVIFSGEAYLQAPLTIEKDIITDIIDEITFDSVTEQGTAIGDALALAASRMLDLKSKSRVILLLTDGMNNRGEIDPETAAKACRENGIKVYTVGIGKEGRVPMPGRGLFGKNYVVSHFDETVLRKVSDMTGGKFYRATSSGVLWEKIRDIDRLEKTEYRVKQYHEFNDSFQIFLLLAAAFFGLEVVLRALVYRKVP